VLIPVAAFGDNTVGETNLDGGERIGREFDG
jgi:hypothetical protein